MNAIRLPIVKPWIAVAAALLATALLTLSPEQARADHASAPSNVTVSPAPDALTVSWDRVTQPSIGTHIYYYLRYRVKSPQGQWQGDNGTYFRVRDGVSGCNGNRCSFNLSNAHIRSLDNKNQGPYPQLVPGTAYDVQVSTAAGVGFGPAHHRYASPVSAIFGAPAPPDPTVESGPANLRMSWTAPSDNGAEITGYSVRWKRSDAAGWDPFNDTGLIPTLNVTILSLESGVQYDLQARAQNSRGWSPWSAVQTGIPEKVGGL